MVDPIISKAAHSLVDHAAQQGPQPPRHVSPEEQSQFEDALHRPGEGAETHPQHMPHHEHEHVHGVENGQPAVGAVEHGHESYQDALIRKLDEAQHSLHVQTEKVEQHVANAMEEGSMTPQQLMKAQFEVMQMSAQVEFVTKGADKVSTDAQTLMNRSN